MDARANHPLLAQSPQVCQAEHWALGAPIEVSFGRRTAMVAPPGAGHGFAIASLTGALPTNRAMVEMPDGTMRQNTYAGQGTENDEAEPLAAAELEELATELLEREYQVVNAEQIYDLAEAALDELEAIEAVWNEGALATGPGDMGLIRVYPIDDNQIEKIKGHYANAGQLLLCAAYGAALDRVRTPRPDITQFRTATPVIYDPGQEPEMDITRVTASPTDVPPEQEDEFIEPAFEGAAPPMAGPAPAAERNTWPWILGGVALVGLIGTGIYAYSRRAA